MDDYTIRRLPLAAVAGPKRVRPLNACPSRGEDADEGRQHLGAANPKAGSELLATHQKTQFPLFPLIN